MIGIYVELWVLVVSLFVFCPLWGLVGCWLGWRARERRMIQEALDFVEQREVQAYESKAWPR